MIHLKSTIISMWNYERLFNNIEELVMHHSPSGLETEIN